MSISKEDIKKLADLSRIEVTEAEAESLKKDIESILGYVGQVSEVAAATDSKEEIELGPVINVLREDENPNESETYTKDIVSEFPNKEVNYLKVKKIL
jgi:aspartyl-tRNA(Asn)/glutamyl-tRNA(Gln) amidotransferase subunit C